MFIMILTTVFWATTGATLVETTTISGVTTSAACITAAKARTFESGPRARGLVMKRIVVALAMLISTAFCDAASAQVRQSKPQSYTYIFGEYDHYAPPSGGGNLDGGGLGVGWRLNRFFGVQGGGQYSRKSGIDLTNLYAEALLILPMGRRFSLYGSFGGSYATASTSVSGATISISRSGYRAGVGAEYWLSNDWALRAGFHRQNAGGVEDDIGVGVAYKF